RAAVGALRVIPSAAVGVRAVDPVVAHRQSPQTLELGQSVVIETLLAADRSRCSSPFAGGGLTSDTVPIPPAGLVACSPSSSWSSLPFVVCAAGVVMLRMRLSFKIT